MEVDVDRRSALDQLDVLVGEWAVIADYEDAPEGRATIEWTLDRTYLLARSAVPHPDFPDTVFIISVNPDGETYSQHYFDTNNSVRVSLHPEVHITVTLSVAPSQDEATAQLRGEAAPAAAAEAAEIGPQLPSDETAES